jgi:hypothetical protein
VAPALATNSVRLRSSSAANLSRTFASGNKRTWTWSAWIKRGALAAANSTVFDTNSSVGGAIRGGIKFQDDCFFINQNPTGSSQTTELKTTAVFRDPSAWYHFVVIWDTAQATASNRVRMYVNGSQITAFGTATYPAQNTDSALNGATLHKLGTDGVNTAAESFDGYLTEVNFIDGQALTPNYFGATNPSTGAWQPATYRGTYGTNGFYLPMNQSFEGTVADFLVVAGGAGGGGGNVDANGGGGGGAGGYRSFTSEVVPLGSNITVTVGAGGAGGSGSSRGSSGSNSVFSTYTSTGGGAGGTEGTNKSGLSGGSGGGSTPPNGTAGGSGNTPSTSPSQGNNGGGVFGNYAGGGGGGGSGSVGADCPALQDGGNGGSSTNNSITGSSVAYAGGGGGGGYIGTAGVGGGAGAGDGGTGFGGSNGGDASIANRGSGGGGSGNQANARNGGAGSSGVVIIKYPDTFTISNSGGGLTFSTASAGGFKTTTFTAGTGNIQIN